MKNGSKLPVNGITILIFPVRLRGQCGKPSAVSVFLRIFLNPEVLRIYSAAYDDF